MTCLFHIKPGVVVALVFLSVGIPVEVGEAKPSAVGHYEFFFLFVPGSAEFLAEEFRTGDGFGESG
jgi:hypothetical protein